MRPRLPREGEEEEHRQAQRPHGWTRAEETRPECKDLALIVGLPRMRWAVLLVALVAGVAAQTYNVVKYGAVVRAPLGHDSIIGELSPIDAMLSAD